MILFRSHWHNTLNKLKIQSLSHYHNPMVSVSAFCIAVWLETRSCFGFLHFLQVKYNMRPISYFLDVKSSHLIKPESDSLAMVYFNQQTSICNGHFSYCTYEVCNNLCIYPEVYMLRHNVWFANRYTVHWKKQTTTTITRAVSKKLVPVIPIVKNQLKLSTLGVTF